MALNDPVSEYEACICGTARAMTHTREAAEHDYDPIPDPVPGFEATGKNVIADMEGMDTLVNGHSRPQAVSDAASQTDGLPGESYPAHEEESCGAVNPSVCDLPFGHHGPHHIPQPGFAPVARAWANQARIDPPGADAESTDALINAIDRSPHGFEALSRPQDILASGHRHGVQVERARIEALIPRVLASWYTRHPCDDETRWKLENYINDLQHEIRKGQA